MNVCFNSQGCSPMPNFTANNLLLIKENFCTATKYCQASSVKKPKNSWLKRTSWSQSRGHKGKKYRHFFTCGNILRKKSEGPRHQLDGERERERERERKRVCIQPGEEGELNLNVLAYKWGFRCVTIRANNVGSHVETTIGLFSLSFSSFNPSPLFRRKWRRSIILSVAEIFTFPASFSSSPSLFLMNQRGRGDQRVSNEKLKASWWVML